jgi:peptide/nickel transport system permease protein
VAVLSGGVSAALMLAGLLAPWIVPYDPYAQNLGARLKPPTVAHWLGTDEVGRDVLSRVVYGVRVSYGIALVSVLLTPLVAVPLGLVAGYYGGWTDTVVMRLIDVMLAFPGLVLALVVVSILGSGAFSVVLATAVFSIPIYARVVRAEILTRRTVDYTVAARAAGQTDLGIIARHLLPNIAGTLIVLSALRMASVLLASAALGFLGLGVQPPEPEWGLMISATRDYIRAAPHVIVGPGLALAVSVLAFNLLGDGLRDVLDPTMRQRLMRTSAS